MSSQAPSLAQFVHQLTRSSTSTSTQSINQYLSQIDIELTRVKTEINSHLKSNWSAIENQWSTSHRLHRESLDHESKLIEIEDTLDNPQNGLVPCLLEAVKTHHDLVNQHSQAYQVFRMTQSLSAAYQALSELSHLIDAGDLVQAASNLPGYKSALRELIDYQAESSLAKRAVRRIQELEEDLKQRLIDDVRSCISFRNGEGDDEMLVEIKSLVNARRSNEANPLIPWSSVIDALQTLGGDASSAGQIQKITISLMDKIVVPIVQSASTDASRKSLVQSTSPSHSQYVLRLKRHGDQQNCDLYGSLRLLCSALQQRLLTTDPLQASFAVHFIPPLQATLLADHLDPALPSTARDNSRLTKLPEVLSQTRIFATWLHDHGWLAASQGHANLLAEWCDNVKDRFVHKVAARILELARKEMISTQWDSTNVSWEIVEPVDPAPAHNIRNSRGSLNSSPSVKPSPVLPNSPTSASTPVMTHRPPEQAGFTSSPKSTQGFKSLFGFGSGASHPRHSEPSSPPRDRSPSPARERPKGFRSLFDFGSELNPRADQGPSRPASSSHTEKTSSPEIIDRLSDVSSQPSLNSKLRSTHLSPTEGESGPSRAEEDVDWDMSGEAPSDHALFQNTAPSSSLVKDVEERVEEDVEEDAWGLDGDGEEPSASPGPLTAQDGAAELVIENSLSASSAPSSPGLKDRASVEEDEEPDPDAWGFEEEETGAVEEGDVMRLRGGVPSAPTSDVDDDGWGWSEDDPKDGQEASADISRTTSVSKKPTRKPAKPSKSLTAGAKGKPKPAIRVESLTISKLAERVLEMVKEVVDDAIATDRPEFPSACLAHSRRALVRVALDVLELFRVVMPVQHAKLLESVPSLSIQFANDCDWLSRQLKSIELTGDEEDAQNLSRRLSLLASQTRQKQMAAQRAVLMECLDEAEGFVDTSDPDRFSNCERACKQLMYTFERLSTVWKPVMLRSEYLKSMGGLIEEVLKRILSEIEAQSDISESDSKQLNKLCKSLHGTLDIFGEDEFNRTEVCRFVPSWFKFCYLSELLEASMADIMWMYQEGHLTEFSNQEIVGLIRALFADSQLRAKNIDLILG